MKILEVAEEDAFDGDGLSSRDCSSSSDVNDEATGLPALPEVDLPERSSVWVTTPLRALRPELLEDDVPLHCNGSSEGSAGNDLQNHTQSLTGAIQMTYVPPWEFDLHVLKKRVAGGRRDHFTIGVWDGLLTMRSVCHVLPIEEALVALRQILEAAGHPSAEDVGADTNPEPRASTGRR